MSGAPRDLYRGPRERHLDLLQTQKSTAPDRTERVLGLLALFLLAVVIVALAKGAGHWQQIPPTIWVHLVAMIVTLALTPALLWQRRGDSRHRLLGWIWLGAMMIAALDSFAIHAVRPGHFSPIHLLSAFVVITVPVAIHAARQHRHARHRRAVRGMVIGGLLIAGVFTFPGGRLLGVWLLS
jgi:uncharacterized membrane protein